MKRKSLRRNDNGSGFSTEASGYSTSNFSTQMIENKNNMDTFKKSVVEFFIHPKKNDLELLELEHKDIKAFLKDKKEQLITKVFAKLLFNL